MKLVKKVQISLSIGCMRAVTACGGGGGGLAVSSSSATTTSATSLNATAVTVGAVVTTVM